MPGDGNTSRLKHCSVSIKEEMKISDVEYLSFIYLFVFLIFIPMLLVSLLLFYIGGGLGCISACKITKVCKKSAFIGAFNCRYVFLFLSVY